MKQKFGTIFFSVSAIIALAIGLFFVKQELLFSVIFFISSFICGVSAYQEHLYHKNKKTLVEKTKIPNEISVGFSKLDNCISILGCSIFIILGFYFLNLTGFEYKKFSRQDYFILLIAGALIVGYAWKIIKKIIQISSNKAGLFISNRGIALHGNSLMNWNEIRNEKVITREERTDGSRYKTEVKYLSLFHQSKGIELKIDDLDIADYTLEQYLKIYRERFNQTIDNSSEKETRSVFESIINIDALLSLSEKELDNEIKKINSLAEKYPQDLAKYCETIVDFKESNLNTIYFALSENSDIWGDFLASEFIRLFEKAKISKDQEIYHVMDEIICDSYFPKVTTYLYNELNNTYDRIRLKALWYMDSWMDFENIQKNDHMVQKIVKMLKDNHWKIRWMANNVLTNFNIFQKEEIEISFIDKLKGKVGNPYEID
ncbi:hypothetical protein [Chryseobacterium defluvii]|uniref:Uncharacterized protein n=1 Tax=Chryseobacterium defluvii TaxID=160396 RepID=A0A495SCF6_9FLAO|nr:hypothetical protein [Chryseobacterium defluvii]RKS97867.1 hypothetical protein BCF58_2001 [Chryseobacterium defluvii]